MCSWVRVRVRVIGFRLENKDQKKIKGTTVPFMANLDIPGNLTSLGLHCVLLN